MIQTLDKSLLTMIVWFEKSQSVYMKKEVSSILKINYIEKNNKSLF